LNTLGHDGRPLTTYSILHRWILNGGFWIREIAYFMLPIPAVGEIVRAANYFKNLYDPTAVSVPRKGFTPTFTFEKTYCGLVGRFKLDWIFVKRYRDRPTESLVPSFGRTLNLVNGAVAPRISPHSPMELEVRFGAPNSPARGDAVQ
jgi:hypothetical protein